MEDLIIQEKETGKPIGLIADRVNYVLLYNEYGNAIAISKEHLGYWINALIETKKRT